MAARKTSTRRNAGTRRSAATRRTRKRRPQARKPRKITKSRARRPASAKRRRKAPARKRAKAAVRKGTKSARKAPRKARKKTGKKKTARKAVKSIARARRSTPAGARKAGKTKKTGKKAGKRKTRKAAPKARRPLTKAATGKPARSKRRRKPETLDRERRRLSDVERTATGLSTAPDERLLLSARAGHDELRTLMARHTATGPRLTAGDVDARWQDAAAIGDEAPGGDNPTPDQDRVEDIGRSLGVTYQDDQELQGGDEITERDRHRWEYDPASSEDWPHDKKKES